MGENEERIPNVNVLLKKIMDFMEAAGPFVESSGDRELIERFEIGDRSLNVLLSLFYEWECFPQCSRTHPRIPLAKCTRTHPAIPDEGCDWTHPRIEPKRA